MEEETASLPSRWPQIVLAALALTILIGAEAFSDRPQAPLKRPWVDRIAPLPAGADRQRFTEVVYSTASFPTGRRPTLISLSQKPRDAEDYRPAPVELGYSINEYVAFAMPFFATTDMGYALYADDDDRMYMAPLGDDGLKVLHKDVGSPIGEGYRLHWWAHLWGWIPLLCLLAAAAFEVRRMRARRVASGILERRTGT